LAVAVDLVRDTSQDEGLRSWCAGVLRRSARGDLLRSLVDFAESSTPATLAQRELLSTLLAAFVETDIWTTAHAFRLMAPESSSGDIDPAAVLPYVFKDHMTGMDAEEIVSSLAPAEIDSLNEAAESRYHRGGFDPGPRWQAYAEAARKLATSEQVEVSNLR